MDKISAVYKIVNTVTGEFYVGSSKDVKKRWAKHKCPSAWKAAPNSKLYQDMQTYGLDCFSFEILEEVEPESLRQTEQKFIELLKPTYNQINAKGWDVERYRECQKEYDKIYRQTAKGKESHKKAAKKYYSQRCSYNGETLTFHALIQRFQRAGIPHPTPEAKKYLV